VKELSDNVFADKYMISRKQVGLIKIKTNVKEKVKIETEYPTVNGKYLIYQKNMNGNNISEFTDRLTGYEFEDNDDILNKIAVNRMDRFPWNNQSNNVRLEASSENKLNMDQCEIKTIENPNKVRSIL
jgi:hypothetical protein